MKSIAFYIGVNLGYGMQKYANEYDEVHAFEPDPEIFKQLKNTYSSYSNVILNNCACSDKTGTSVLYITKNRVSTSLSDVDHVVKNKLGYDDGVVPFKEVQVNTVNLYQYILLNKIEYIDFLLTDAQGCDFTILKTIEKFIKQKKVKKIFCETHNNGKGLYSSFDNQFDNFKDLLLDDYEIKYYNFGGNILPNTYQIQETDIEWDTVWELK